MRQFRLPLPVTLTSDTALMDATYITACVQKDGFGITAAQIP